MTDSEFTQIIEEKKRKYLPARSSQLFHGGVIFLVSFLLGLLYFQFAPMPSDVKPEDLNRVRQGFGIWLGIWVAIGGMVLYLGWTLLRGLKAKQEAQSEILAVALKRLEKK